LFIIISMAFAIDPSVNRIIAPSVNGILMAKLDCQNTI
jgi:hypothetical protein